jgi:MFS family permease
MTAEIAAAGGVPKPAAEGASSAWPPARVAYYTLVVLILSTTCSQLDIAIVPYLGPYIKGDLHLSDYDFSLMVGLSFGLFYTAVGIPIAWFLDRFSRKHILALAITVWCVGTALCGAAQSYLQLFLARFLVGAGEAVNGPAAYSITADLFPRERMPRAIAILQIGSVAGPLLSTTIAALALTAFAEMHPIHVPFGSIHGWQMIFIVVGLPGVLIALLMLTTMREPVRHTIPDQVSGFTETPKTLIGAVISVFQDYGLALDYILKQWKVFVPMFASLFIGSLGTGAMAFMPMFYMRTFGWKPAQLAALNIFPALILMPLGLVIGVMLAEYLAKKKRDDAALLTQIISRLIALPGMFAVLMPNPWLVWAFGTLGLFSIGIGGPAQNAAFQIVTPTELRGKMTALYLFIYSVVGVAFAPVLTGALSTFFVGEGNIRMAIFLPAAILGPISLFITFLGLKPYEREVKRLRALEGQTA